MEDEDMEVVSSPLEISREEMSQENTPRKTPIRSSSSFLSYFKPSNVDAQTLPTIKKELRNSVVELSSRCMYHASKWAAELLNSIENDEDENESVPPSPLRLPKHEEDILEQDKVMLAKSYFDLREYLCAAQVLKNSQGQKSRFLRNYALYLAGEQRKEDEKHEEEKNSSVVNRQLSTLNQEYQAIVYSKDQELDAFNLYLYGIILRDMDQKEKSKKVLIQSVNKFPCNWSAWLDLTSLYNSDQETNIQVGKLKESLPKHWMSDIFLAHFALELQQNESALNMYEPLSQVLDASNFILSEKAIAHYNMREFDMAEQIFETLISRDKYRLDNLDIYSNILYVKENKSKLSFLAHLANETDKYRPETCCIVGNYYSIKGEHEKAVAYFRRALKLNNKFLSAWTLMGHEFLEMKNTPAAIEAYRKAVAINPRDYRAWYGLGQTYELLTMPHYALYYYNKAASLRPYDARMWCALGSCYETLSQTQQAIRCYERAESNTDPELIAMSKLATLYRKIQNDDKAAYYYKRSLDFRDSEGAESRESVEALLFLAFYCKNKGKLDEAEMYCSRLLDFAGREKEEAKALLREIHSERAK